MRALAMRSADGIQSGVIFITKILHCEHVKQNLATGTENRPLRAAWIQLILIKLLLVPMNEFNNTAPMKTKNAFPFIQVDVFCASPSQPMTGNPVAVVFNTDDWTAEQMQRVARWTNLSETTFASKVSANQYHLRIFTPGGELPFAGHPSLGSAFAVAQHLKLSGQKISLTQHCGVGAIALEVNMQASAAKLVLPKAFLTSISAADQQELEQALGCTLQAAPMIVDLGPKWLTAPIATGEALLALQPNLDKIGVLSQRLGITGVNLFGQYQSSDEVEVRSFAPHLGVPEDPVCGSGNGAVAYYRRDQQHISVSQYQARQGRAIARDGAIQIGFEANQIWLGGVCLSVVSGEISL